MSLELCHTVKLGFEAILSRFNELRRPHITSWLNLTSKCTIYFRKISGKKKYVKPLRALMFIFWEKAISLLIHFLHKSLLSIYHVSALS